MWLGWELQGPQIIDVTSFRFDVRWFCFIYYVFHVGQSFHFMFFGVCWTVSIVCSASPFVVSGCKVASSGVVRVVSALQASLSPRARRGGPSRSSGRRYRRFRRRKLHYNLVRRCLRRRFVYSLAGLRVRQHRRWRRRKARWRAKYTVKRRELRRNKFLTPLPSARQLWNARRRVDKIFLTTETTSFEPHAVSGVVPDEVLDEFCCDRGDTFLGEPKLMRHFGTLSLEEGAAGVVNRLSLFKLAGGVNGEPEHRATFKDCPLVWDTGASFGLTPFRGDFIDYVECKIEVRDIARSNTVVGVGTTLHKFQIDGNDIFIPCLSYHLPSAEIRLFSPQTYHNLYGGHSAVFGQRVEMFIDHLRIGIGIDPSASNVPMVYNCLVSAQEMKDHAPFIRSALPKYEMKMDFLGGWSSEVLKSWNMASEEINSEFGHYCRASGFGLPNVGVDANVNLTSAQKELLLWHWKLGISMQRIQELMRVVEVHELDGAISTMDRVICPKIRSASTCPIPLCQSCQLSRAKQRKPSVTKSKAVPEEAGALSRDKYETGDFVSLDQYVVKTPGRLPTGYGREAHYNLFHGGTIFRDAASKYIFVQNQVSLGAGETVNAKMRFEEWLWEAARERVKHYHSDNGIFTAQTFKDACAEEQQTQSFSGVGAKHQNAEAERAIQTGMYMARSFMIHAALHWGEDGSDDISLWSFAVDHAAWLYNRIPQRRSGITPLEMVTRCKSDHRDLMRTHVWGCPVYVLEPQLQDGKKLPKWNRRARMGQFLGFSRVHSSTVALVRNLHTGHVSPQYHVVFDDKFETVFNDGKSSEELDRICSELFIHSRECYAEEEYDEDGLLIYTPPPLDEVWLSESDRRERRKVLEEQRTRVQRQRDVETKEVKRRLVRSREPVPDLAESDVDTA